MEGLNMNKHTGGCLCGSVRFELNKEPDFAYGCHCRFCQKATGTAFRSGLRCQKSSVKFNDEDAYIISKNCGEWGEGPQDKNLIYKQSCGTQVKYINKIIVNEDDEIIEIQQYIEPLNKLMTLKKSSSTR